MEFSLNLGRYDLLTTASAIAFRVLFAFVPLAAAALAFLGLAHLGDLYHDELAPAIQDRATPAQYEVVNTVAESILGQGSGFWLTLGLVIAIWEVSGAVRGAMGALNRVYGRDDTRSFWRRMGVSIVLGLVVSASFAVAIGALGFGHEVASRVTDAGWGTALSVILTIGVAGLAAFVGVAVLIRFGTSKRHTAGWLGFVSVLVVALWIAATFILTWYLVDRRLRLRLRHRGVVHRASDLPVLDLDPPPRGSAGRRDAARAPRRTTGRTPRHVMPATALVASGRTTTEEGGRHGQAGVLIEVAVKPGQLDNFRKLMDEMVESTQAEPETLSYDWFVSADGSAVHIYERYADSEALVTHITGFGRSSPSASSRWSTRSSSPSTASRAPRPGEAMSGFSPTYLGTFGGFVR